MTAVAEPAPVTAAEAAVLDGTADITWVDLPADILPPAPMLTPAEQPAIYATLVDREPLSTCPDTAFRWEPVEAGDQS